ncbi:MAG TPA: hypothetical protein VNI61_01000 [Gemmatimonadales bacterium]|nr:hypothetical protein [Gemmatimonadales bacterium]
MQWSRKVLLLWVALLVTACGTARTSDTGPAASTDRVLLQEEIEKSGAGTLYDAIRMRRPRWLRPTPRGPTSLTRASAEVTVYLDGQRLGGPESLRRLTAGSALWVEFLSPSEAQARFGSDNLAGVIHVHTRGTPARPE